MRYVYITLLGLLLAVVLIFALQNIGLTTVLFLDMSVTLPLALIVVGFYILGMLTGGFMFALIKSWLRGTGR